MSIFSNRQSTAESVGIAVAVQLGALFNEAGMGGVLDKLRQLGHAGAYPNNQRNRSEFLLASLAVVYNLAARSLLPKYREEFLKNICSMISETAGHSVEDAANIALLYLTALNRPGGDAQQAYADLLRSRLESSSPVNPASDAVFTAYIDSLSKGLAKVTAPIIESLNEGAG